MHTFLPFFVQKHIKLAGIVFRNYLIERCFPFFGECKRTFSALESYPKPNKFLLSAMFFLYRLKHCENMLLMYISLRVM